MSERKTISASKGLFHKDFPFVIPSIYRKVVDEYLVELNLLSNQSSFKIDGIFSYGLIKSFDIFTKGYDPNNHKAKILQSLCKSCDIEYSVLDQYSKVILDITEKSLLDDIINELNINDNKTINGININDLIHKENYYSRLHSIGVYELVEIKEKSNKDQEEKEKEAIKILTALGFCENRVVKDIALYKSNIKRIEEAMELIKVTSEETKRKQTTKQV